MLIINKYSVNSTDPSIAVALNTPINPSVTTGNPGGTAANDTITTTSVNAVYEDKVICKLVQISLTNLTNLVNNYIQISTKQLGIPGLRRVIAASFLGVYNPNSVETGDSNTVTPSFIAYYDKVTINVFSVSVIRGNLVIRIPANNVPLFKNKYAMIQLYYSTNQ